MDLVLGEPSPASRSNTTAARAVIPVQKLQQNPFARIVASVPGRSTFSLSPDRRRYLLAYWCHGFEYINLVLYATDDIPGMVLDTMRGETTRRDVAAALEQFHPDLGTVCDHLLDVLPLWRQHTRAPAPRYTRGRLVVIGDAAHAMLSVSIRPSSSPWPTRNVPATLFGLTETWVGTRRSIEARAPTLRYSMPQLWEHSLQTCPRSPRNKFYYASVFMTRSGCRACQPHRFGQNRLCSRNLARKMRRSRCSYLMFSFRVSYF